MPRRQENWLFDYASTCGLFLFIISAFLILFTYTDNAVPQINGVFHLDNILITDFNNNEFHVQNFTYECENNQCVKKISKGKQASLATCNMFCPGPLIWPLPRQTIIRNRNSSTINKNKVSFAFHNEGRIGKMLKNITDSFVKNLESLNSGNLSTPGLEVYININLFDNNLADIKLNTNESYSLNIQKNENLNVTISAANFFGARHALETLLQLIWYDEFANCLFIMHDIEIKDFPEFSYRGVMLDIARNYMPLYLIKKVIDGMGMSKLNVLHLHLTDAVSFPIVLPSVKQLASYGAYGKDMIYTSSDINNLVEYALLKGIRISLEIDAPSHVNAGWDSFNEKYVICGESDVLNGHLNPDNDNVLLVLEMIYSDLLKMNTNNELFHIGGDEVNLTCWQKTEAGRRTNSMRKLWANYTNKMLASLKQANNDITPDHVIMWSSPLTESPELKNLDVKITVQHWLGSPQNVLSNGNKIIYSTVGHWYLDCGFGHWKPSLSRGVCDPYTPWQKFYKYRPWREFGHKDATLGGEVCLWAEEVEVDTLETRVWPRAAAFAERVWSDNELYNLNDVSKRLASFAERLKASGIKTAAMWPRWCTQNPGRC